ncbi:AMP-binding protein [Zestomonas thermotolerans]|uniref:AMP-binding protein n=1 Tax=Zestomonas thermotolerans TaxID=157784 RepID=UPI00048683FA|nr:AMP-binding protein [Pseudomonas thermotolerans]
MSDATTLPAWLAHQSRRRPHGIALRHKRLGIWQAYTWAEVEAEVLALAGSLRARGFGAGAQLVILSGPRPEALFATLAAQWLGGAAALFDPQEELAAQLAALREVRAGFALAEGVAELQRLRAAGLGAVLLAYADGRGLAALDERAGLQGYAELIAAEPHGVAPQAQPGESAFVFYRQGAEGIERQDLSHAELLGEGRRLVAAEGLGAGEEALAARAFAASGQARYLLAPWLLAGFRLNFPERLETRDRDRRELGPTLVLGTRETYGRLYAWASQRLPLPGSASRRLVDWALAGQGGPLGRLLGDLLVRRPLCDVLGFSRTRVPLLVGAPLDEPARLFFAALGIEVRNWAAPERWQDCQPQATPTWHLGQPQTA